MNNPELLAFARSSFAAMELMDPFRTVLPERAVNSQTIQLELVENELRLKGVVKTPSPLEEIPARSFSVAPALFRRGSRDNVDAIIEVLRQFRLGLMYMKAKLLSTGSIVAFDAETGVSAHYSGPGGKPKLSTRVDLDELLAELSDQKVGYTVLVNHPALGPVGANLVKAGQPNGFDYRRLHNVALPTDVWAASVVTVITASPDDPTQPPGFTGLAIGESLDQEPGVWVRANGGNAQVGLAALPILEKTNSVHIFQLTDL